MIVLCDALEAVAKLRWTGMIDVKGATCLGRTWRRTSEGFAVSLPPRYFKTLLEEFHMESAKPMVRSSLDGSRVGNDFTELSDAETHNWFRRGVGRLFWVAFVCPDIFFITKELARQVAKPTFQNWRELKRVL